MNPKDYVENALKTESRNVKEISERIATEYTIRVLHAGIGLSTEAAEILDALKKHIFYGKPLDAVNLAEEMGDMFFYLAILSDTLGIDFERVMENNVEKLKKRYGDKFDAGRAINRDLPAEREILEKV